MTRRGLACVLALVLVAGCKGEAQRDDGQPTANLATAPSSIPTTEAGFLAELAPLPADAKALEVHYQITGSGLTGEMVVTIAAGGQRRERWDLRAGAGETQLRTAGLRIVSTDEVWLANEGVLGERSANHLGALARAWLALEPDARVKIVESIRAWHRMLAEQRAADPGARGEILGVACLQTRIAAQNVCMWEEAGLLLRYEGSAFTIEATEINRAPAIGAETFALPPEAKSVELEPSTPPDHAAILSEIAAGSYGSVSALVLANEVLPALHVPESESEPESAPPP